MLKTISFLLTAVFICLNANSQTVQTIRGQVIDGVTNMPLIGVSVMIENSPGETLQGGISDGNGIYRIDKIPVGRHTIKVTFIGYEEQVIPNVVVTAGKEVVLNIALTESINRLSEIMVTANTNDDKTATNNELAVVSARSFNVDDTKHYAGSLGDPARMAANFAGVIGGNDSRNNIIVRGNSSSGMLWQLEGMNIPNPNHFGALSTTGGPISLLNNNTLDKSDFIISAFPAQYGNAIAGVFDIRLREGNNEKTEVVAQAGFNGFEAGMEGPFSKKSKASYLVNARYSTLVIFQKLGIQFGTGTNTPFYEDINFKISVPTKKGAKVSLFGLGGNSAIDLLGSRADTKNNSNLYGSENIDSYPRYQTGITGLSYEKKISSSTYARIIAGASAANEHVTEYTVIWDSLSSTPSKDLNRKNRFSSNKYSLNFLTRTKFNAKSSLISGFNLDLTHFQLYQQQLNLTFNISSNTVLYQFYSTWKYRFNHHWLLNSGVHTQYYTLSEQWVAEPRLGLQYVLTSNHSVAIGYGIHNQTQNITTSFYPTLTRDGSLVSTDKMLGYTTSHHYVITYDWNISEHTRLKAETYYQNLTHVPIEQRSSSFSIINAGNSPSPVSVDSLVNKGVGKNYGIELTLERFFSKGLYYLITASLFNSRYKGSDGIERNTAYNGHYVLNVLAGKEWRLKYENFISVNIKFTTVGGQYFTPIDMEKSRLQHRTILDRDNAFTVKQDPYLRFDLRISYRKEFSKKTLEASIDFQNVTNHKNIYNQSYDSRTGSLNTQYQQSFFPIPYIRFTF